MKDRYGVFIPFLPSRTGFSGSDKSVSGRTCTENESEVEYMDSK